MRLKALFTTIGIAVLVYAAALVFFVFPEGQTPAKTNPAAKNQNYTAAEAKAFILPISETNYWPIRDFNIPDPAIAAKAAAIFDVRSGRLLYAKNYDQRLPIASVTKLMTAAVILENLDLNQIFTIPVEDLNVDGFGADLYKDEKLRGEDLLKIMLIKSSNDAALTFATEAQKQGINLVAKMNEKAQSLGMADTLFTDPAGLDDSGSFSTAADLIKLARYLNRHPRIWEILKIPSLDVTSADGRINHHLINTDKLLGQIPGIVGGKTGYTDVALGSLILSVKINGNRDTLINVVLGSNDRFRETKVMIYWAQRAYRWN